MSWNTKGFSGGFQVPRDVALAMLLLVLTLLVSGTYLLSIRFPWDTHPGCVSGIILNPSLALVRVKPATRLARGLEVSGINRSSFKAKPLLRSYRSLAELPCSSDSHLPRAGNMTNRTTTNPVM